MNDQVLTPKERPTHHAIGRFFYAWDSQICYCDSYDPRADFWMTNVVDGTIRRAVSPRAIGRTFHHAGDSPKPQLPEDAIGREYYSVDTRLPPGQMAIVFKMDKDCFGLDDRIALFFYETDATKFIKRALEAEAALKEKTTTAQTV